MSPTSRPSRRLGGLVVLAAASTLALAGCFSGGSSSSSGTAGAGSSGEGSGDGGGRMSIAMLQPPRSGLTPLSDDAFSFSRWSTAETLIVLDENGDAEPALATEWEQTSPTEWVFTIRDGVTFHDGTEPARPSTSSPRSPPRPRPRRSRASSTGSGSRRGPRAAPSS